MPKTLLLADDSVTIQKVVGITFANEDVTLVTVDNGDDALVRARAIKPDCVLADVSMPGLTGYELCAAIRAEPELAHVPVLLLTGTFETYDSQRAGDAGADGYIAKPFEAQALVERVRALLAKPRAAAAPAPAPTPKPAAAPQPLRPESAAIPRTPAPAAPPVVAPPVVAPPKPVAAPLPPAPRAPQPALDPSFDEIPDEQLTVYAPPPELASADEERAAPTRIFEADDDEIAPEMATQDPLFGAEPAAARAEEESTGSGDLFEESSFPDPTASQSASTDLDTEPLEAGEPIAPDADAPEDSEPDTARGAPSYREAPSWAAREGVPPADDAAEEESELPWAEALELDEPESDDSLADLRFAPSEPAPEHTRFRAPESTRPGLLAPASAPQPARPAAAPALDARVLREALEKVAWEAFGPLSEQIVRDVVARVEAIAWEVVPQIAERLIREEIAALKRESSD